MFRKTEKKKIAVLSSDSAFKAKVSVFRRSAFLEGALTHHEVIVFFHQELFPEVTIMSRKSSVGG